MLYSSNGYIMVSGSDSYIVMIIFHKKIARK